MDYIGEQLREAIRELALSPEQAAICDEREAAQVRRQAMAAFGIPESAGWWWDALGVPHEGFQFPSDDAYRHLMEYIPPDTARCWLVVENDRGEAWHVLDIVPEVAGRLIGELQCVEYYLVGKEFAWLVCENHHDYLVVARR